MQIDLRVLELLSSKVCHDLVSPVSAINNGVELIEDIGGSVIDDAIQLIAASGANAARRLRLFRIAYGRAGSEENISVKDVRNVIEQYLSVGKVSITWDDAAMDEAFTGHRGALKTLINTVALAEEMLPYGGTLTLRPLEADDSLRAGCILELSGRAAQLSEPMQNALEATTPVDALTPRTIQAYITGRFAAHFGLQIASRQSVADKMDFALTILRGEYDENHSL